MPRKLKINKGWFAVGHDPRRHQLTREERRRGGLTRAKQILVDMHRSCYRLVPGETTPFEEEEELPW